MMTADADLAAGLDLSAAADLSVNLSRVADELAAQRHAREKEIQDCHSAPILVPQIVLTSGAGTLDLPDRLGPKRGYHWAVRYITAASFTAGSVVMYRGAGVMDANIRFTFTSAGIYEPGRASCVVAPGDRLIFVASGITGAVTISGEVTEFKSHLLHRFLL